MAENIINEEKNENVVKSAESEVYEITSKINSLQSEIDTLITNNVSEFKIKLCKAIVELLNKSPELEFYTWVQYIPYFNDGDACTFGVHCDSDYTIYAMEKEPSKEAIKILGQIEQLLWNASDYLMEAAFDRDVKITVHKNGNVDEEYYEHD